MKQAAMQRADLGTIPRQKAATPPAPWNEKKYQKDKKKDSEDEYEAKFISGKVIKRH